MDKRELSFASEGHTLVGTLQLPTSRASTGPVPAALLVSGSGPIDRDSSMRGQRLNIMNQVAEHLASAGIASLRYDKRGVGASDGDYKSTGFYDNVADANAGLAALRTCPEVDAARVVVIGHSEGAFIAPELARDENGPAGVVLLSGAAKTGEDTLRWQAARIGETLPKPVKAVLRLLRKDLPSMQAKRLAKLKETEGDVERVQLVRVNAKWLREILDYDPSQALRNVRVPVLAITGAKDIQVDPSDVESMEAMIPTDFTGEIARNVTHILRRDEGPPSLRSYRKQAKRPVDRRVLEMISSWVGRLSVSPPTENLNTGRMATCVPEIMDGR